MMKFTLALLVALSAVCLPATAGAGELEVARANEVRPDTDLLALVAEFRALAARGDKKSVQKVESFFAPRVKSFTRSLDPFQPWHPLEDITGKFLDGVADVMVEKGELADGMPVPDYRLDAMKMIDALMVDGTFGTMPEVPGAICTPAVYEVDREAATAFARKFKLDAYSLRFYPEDVILARKAKGRTGTIVPANTMMMFDYDPKAPEGWALFETAGGVKGYMKDRDDVLGLSQNHVCFARLKGKYRISAVFGYGL